MCKGNGVCSCVNKCDKCKELIKKGLVKDVSVKEEGYFSTEEINSAFKQAHEEIVKK